MAVITIANKNGFVNVQLRNTAPNIPMKEKRNVDIINNRHHQYTLTNLSCFTLRFMLLTIRILDGIFVNWQSMKKMYETLI